MLNYLLFIAGVLTSALILVILKKYSNRNSEKNIVINQSSMFLLIKTFMPEAIEAYINKDTQSLSYEDNKTFKFIEMPDHKAYWIDKNNVYYADIKDDGRFNPAEGKLSAMKNLSEKQINKMLFIYNSLKNG